MLGATLAEWQKKREEARRALIANNAGEGDEDEIPADVLARCRAKVIAKNEARRKQERAWEAARLVKGQEKNFAYEKSGKPLLMPVRYDGQPPEDPIYWPLWKRALTIAPAVIGFLFLDVLLYQLTMANTIAIGFAPDPFSKGVLIFNEILLGAVDIFVAYLHVSYVHWVVTGRGVHTWSDLVDWELRP